MTIYHVDKYYDSDEFDDIIYYIVSPYNLMGMLQCFVRNYGFMTMINWFKMSRFSEKRANQLADKMNKVVFKQRRC